MRTPKLRGFKNPFKVEYQVVNVSKLADLFPEGGKVTVDDLVAKGAVRKGEPVKVLGNGDISVKLDVTVEKVSRFSQGENRGCLRIRKRLNPRMRQFCLVQSQGHLEPLI
jgi:Ribosomal protein L15